MKNKKTTETVVENCRLFKSAHQNFIENFKGHDYKDRERILNSPEVRYLSNVMNTLVRISELFRKLDFIEVFLKEFPRPKYYEKQNISELDWIYYHYINYIISIASIFEVTLILVNNVYRLGFKEEHCKLYFISDNLKIPNKLKIVLGKYDKEINHFKFIRNKYLHRGQLDKSDEEIVTEMVLYFQSKGEDIPQIKSINVKERIIKNKYNLIKKLINIRKTVEKLLVEILDLLANIYEKEYMKIQIFSIKRLTEEIERRSSIGANESN